MAHASLSTAIVTFVFVLVGCEASTPQTPTSSEQMEPANRSQMSFTQPIPLLSGEPLKHVFPCSNRTEGILHLVTTGGVKKSCGCTSVNVDKRDWAPGESISVDFEVDTTGKSGEIHESAIVDWETSSGERFPLQLEVNGTVILPIVAVPKALTFSQEEIKTSIRKKIRLQSDLKVDWSTLRPQFSKDDLHIGEAVPANGGVEFEIAWNDGERKSIGFQQRIIEFEVQVSAAESRMAGDRLRVVVLCTAYTPAPFLLSPQTARLICSADNSVAYTQLHVESDLVPEMISTGFSIADEEGRLDFTYKRLAANRLFVKVNMDPKRVTAASRISVLFGDPAVQLGSVDIVVPGRD